MKKLLLLLLLSSYVKAQIATDKIEHFVGGVIITQITYQLTPKLTKNNRIILSISTPIAIGLAKELYDSRKGGTGFDVNDLIATSLGGVTFIIPLNMEKQKYVCNNKARIEEATSNVLSVLH